MVLHTWKINATFEAIINHFHFIDPSLILVLSIKRIFVSLGIKTISSVTTRVSFIDGEDGDRGTEGYINPLLSLKYLM